MLEKTQPSLCPNCEKNSGSGKFCQECGQKNAPLKLNLWTIFGIFFSIVFNLDNQFFRTIRAAFIPGKLATAFIKGKRKMYLHPFRFFFYTWVFLALVMNIDVKKDNYISEGFKDGFNNLKTEKDSLNDSNTVWNLESINDSLRSNFDNNKNFQINFSKKSYRFTSDSTKCNTSTDTIVILYQDLESLSEEQLFEKYHITSWLEKLFIKRTKRFKSGSFVLVLQFLIDNIIWLFLFIMPLSALRLTFLFWHSKKYYSEHILYLMYLFSVLFIIISVVILLGLITENDNHIVTFLIWILIIYYMYYSFSSMKRFYKRSTKISIWKWVNFLVGNILLFGWGTIVYIIISLFLS